MTTDKLRHSIDQGLTGDKVPFSDPSAAPLGTDDEAAGTPPSEDRIKMAEASTPHAAVGLDPGATDERGRPSIRAESSANYSILIAAAFVLVIGATAVALIY